MMYRLWVWFECFYFRDECRKYCGEVLGGGGGNGWYVDIIVMMILVLDELFKGVFECIYIKVNKICLWDDN